MHVVLPAGERRSSIYVGQDQAVHQSSDLQLYLHSQASQLLGAQRAEEDGERLTLATLSCHHDVHIYILKLTADLHIEPTVSAAEASKELQQVKRQLSLPAHSY